MPTPNPEESKQEFIRRCIPLMLDEGKPHKQAVAICLNIWNRNQDNPKEENIIDYENYSQIINEGIITDTVSSIITNPNTLSTIGSALTTPTALKIGAAVGIGALTIADILNKRPDILSADFKKPDSGKLLASDTNSNVNKIVTRPQGIIICDTINNPIFPIPYPLIDDSKFNLPFIKRQYVNIYTLMSVDFLPWHYVIEMIDGKYYAFQTRPIDMKYPVTSLLASQLIESNNMNLNDSAKKYFKDLPFDLSDAIHVCILGDTKKDVYIERLYELIGRLCSGPFLRYFRMPSKVNQRVINFNLGSKFIFNKLDQYLPR